MSDLYKLKTSKIMKKALLVIDVQYDYMSQGKFPLWEDRACLAQVLDAIDRAKAKDYPIILIQHVADPKLGLAPFFIEDTEGVEILTEVKVRVPNAPIVVKHYADAFVETTLNTVLEELDVNELLICGMMTQNCVTHTAISNKKNKAYTVSVLKDACTTVSEPIHLIALAALSTWVPLIGNSEI